METTTVEARFDQTGEITVLSFTWRGRARPVTSVGRHWSAADGRHFLVMTTGERVFELLHEPESGAWKIVSEPERGMRA